MPHDAPDFENEFERALAAYADPGDAGYPQTLTMRVMAAVEMRRRNLRWWLAFSVAVPALVCLLVAALLYWRRAEPQHQETETASIPSTTQSVAATPKIAVPARVHVETARNRAVRNAPRQLPKLDQFPAPTALTEQEQVLVQFVTYAPPNTQQLVANAQKEPDKPLHIAELGIPYLDSSTQP
jgi:hypothetical protein